MVSLAWLVQRVKICIFMVINEVRSTTSSPTAQKNLNTTRKHTYLKGPGVQLSKN